MRRTLDIADDVLQAARERARREGRTDGEVISELARQSLAHARATIAGTAGELGMVYGFRAFPSRDNVVTNELIDQLRDESAY